MKITQVIIYRFSIGMVPFEIATGRMDYAQNVLIKICTDTEITGIGECSAFPMIVGETQQTCLVLAKDFAAIWKGKDPLAIEERLAELDSYIANNTTIKSAFDIALYDIAAKEAGVPLYKYLGGTLRKINTDITVGIGAPNVMAATAAKYQQQGAKSLKIKLGKKPQQDIDRIKTIRRAIGDKLPIRVDANQGWTFEEAVQVLKELEGARIEFCEQPMRTYDDHLLPALRRQTSIPIMADESCYNYHDVERLAKDGACDYINIKFAKSGGIYAAFKITKAALKYQIPCMMGGMLESRVALTAMLHFVMANENIQFYDLDTALLGQIEDPVENGAFYEQYKLHLPELPGIGADVQAAFLEKCDQWVV